MPEIYQIKVTLVGSKPPIWRRIQVPASIKLSELHWILQQAMGWTDSHMHAFSVGGRSYGEADPELEMADEGRVTLNKVVKGEKVKFRYEYDFGDGWEHQLLVEKVLPADPDVHYPRCVTGKRRCPPEDCGGIWGYARLVEALHDPRHPEHEDMKEWFEGGLDPEEFDLERINRALGQA